MRSARGLASAAVGASFAVAFLAYCGGVSPSDAGPTCDCPAAVVKSGTRLRSRVRTSPDGASQFLGWFDRELGVSCDFVRPGGNTSPYIERCAPASWPSLDAAHFADAACTSPVGIVYPELAADTRFCLVRGKDFVRLGAALPKIYAKDRAGGCIESHDAFAQTPGATFYTCDGEPVAPEIFVKMADSVD